MVQVDIDGEIDESDGDETDADAAAAMTAAAAVVFPVVATIFSIKLPISSCLFNPFFRLAGIGDNDDVDDDDDNGVVDDDDMDVVATFVGVNGFKFNLEYRRDG